MGNMVGAQGFLTVTILEGLSNRQPHGCALSCHTISGISGCMQTYSCFCWNADDAPGTRDDDDDDDVLTVQSCGAAVW
jgi:hypothetical protein